MFIVICPIDVYSEEIVLWNYSIEYSLYVYFCINDIFCLLIFLRWTYKISVHSPIRMKLCAFFFLLSYCSDFYFFYLFLYWKFSIRKIVLWWNDCLLYNYFLESYKWVLNRNTSSNNVKKNLGWTYIAFETFPRLSVFTTILP